MSSSQSACSAPSSIRPVTISEINMLLSLVTLKLEESNFLKWNFQFQTVLEIHDLFGFFNGSYLCPLKFMTTNEGMVTSEVTVAYTQWQKVDKALLSLLMATLDIDMMDIVVGSRSSHEAWFAIQERFLPVSRANVMQLETDLLTIKKGSDSIEKYLLRIKLARYRLSLVGVTILDEDIVLVTLNGLPIDFSTIKTVIRARDSPICFKDLRVHLLAAERDVKFQFSASAHNLRAPAIDAEGSFYSNKGRSNMNGVDINQSSMREQKAFFSANTRENTFHQSSSSTFKLFCEICNKTNHVTSNCFQNIRCSFCDRMGHVSTRCYNNPSSLFYKPQLSIFDALVANNLSSYGSSGSNDIAEVDTSGVFGGINVDTRFSGRTGSEILDFENFAGHDGIRGNNADKMFLDDNGEKNAGLKVSSKPRERNAELVVSTAIGSKGANLVLLDRNGDQNSDMMTSYENSTTSNKKTAAVFSGKRAYSVPKITCKLPSDDNARKMEFSVYKADPSIFHSERATSVMYGSQNGVMGRDGEYLDNTVEHIDFGSLKNHTVKNTRDGLAIDLENIRQGLGLADQVVSIDQQKVAPSQKGENIARNLHSVSGTLDENVAANVLCSNNKLGILEIGASRCSVPETRGNVLYSGKKDGTENIMNSNHDQIMLNQLAQKKAFQHLLDKGRHGTFSCGMFHPKQKPLTSLLSDFTAPFSCPAVPTSA